MAIMQNGKIVLDPIMMRQYSMTLNMMEEKANAEEAEAENYEESIEDLPHYRSQIDAIEAFRAGVFKEFQEFVCDDMVQIITLNKDGEINFLYRVEVD